MKLQMLESGAINNLLEDSAGQAASVRGKELSMFQVETLHLD